MARQRKVELKKFIRNRDINLQLRTRMLRSYEMEERLCAEIEEKRCLKNGIID